MNSLIPNYRHGTYPCFDTWIEYGNHSPIHTKCYNKGVSLHDMELPRTHRKLLFLLFAHYNTRQFTRKQVATLRYLDSYLDIPLIEAVLDTESSFHSFHRLVTNHCTVIPLKYKNNRDLVIECIQHDSVATYQKALEFGCKPPLHYTQTGLAIMFGSLNILTYLASQHLLDWNEWSCSNATACRYDFMPTCICFTGNCFFNDTDTSFMHRKTCSKSLINHVKEDKVLACLLFTIPSGCPTNVLTCAYAAAHGRLDCLKYLHEQECPWDEVTCIYAAANGHIDCLRYAHEHGCQWTASVCIEAIRNGQLECLQYAHDHGCEWAETTFTLAAELGRYECLTYLATHRRYVYSKLVTEVAIKYAQKYNHTNCATYLSKLMTQNCAQADDLCIRDRDSWKILKYRLKEC